jgi:hypothetical protein
VLAFVGIAAFVVGWAWGKWTGYADGRRAGHYEMAVVAADLRAADMAHQKDLAERWAKELWEQMNRHTNASPVPDGIEPFEPAPITTVFEKVPPR